MALYSFRLEEITSAVRVPEATDTARAGERGTDQAAVLARYTGFMNEMKRYEDWRDDVLQEALSLLKEESSSPSGPAYQSKWAEHFAKLSAEAAKRVIDALKDAQTVAPDLCAFAQTVSTQEAAFFAQCGRMPLAQISAQAQLYALDFYREADRLEEKWKSLGDSDRSIDEKIADTTKQIEELFKETVENLIAEERGLVDKAKNVKLDPTAVITTWKSAVAAVAKAAVQKVMTVLEQYKKGTSEYVEILMQKHHQEETLVILFTQIRESVREFVKKTNYELATREFNEAVSAAEAAASSCPTSGGQKDAKLFAQTATATVKPFMDELKKGFEDFMNQFREIFTGAVGDKTVEELVELSERLKSWDEIERVNLPGRLDAALQDFENSWQVNVDGLSDDDKEALRQVWKTELDVVGKGIVEAKQDRIRDRIPMILRDKKRELMEKLRGSKGGGE